MKFVLGMESCYRGAVYRPLSPSGTDKESCCYQGQKSILTYCMCLYSLGTTAKAKLILYLKHGVTFILTGCIMSVSQYICFYVTRCSSLLKIQWRRGWWPSRGRSRTWWRRLSAPQTVIGKHLALNTSRLWWSCEYPARLNTNNSIFDLFLLGGIQFITQMNICSLNFVQRGVRAIHCNRRGRIKAALMLDWSILHTQFPNQYSHLNISE